MKKVLTFLLVFTLGFTLASCTNQEDVTNVADAAQKLSLDVSDPTAVTSDIVLPTEGLHESTISWESDNTAVIATDGKVTRPAVGEDDATVKLTATLTVGKETETKDFTLKVLAAVPSVAATIAEFKGSDIAIGDVVELTGVVVGLVKTYGYQIYDGTGFGYVNEFQSPTVSIGDEVTVMGEKDVFNSSYELVEITSTVVNSTGNAVPAFVETTINDIYAQDYETTTWFNGMYNVDAYAYIAGTYNNAYLGWYNTDLDLLSMEVYYKSWSDARVAEIKALEGKFVNVDVTLKDYSYGYRVTVNENGAVVENTTATDQEKANLAVAFNDLVFKGLGEEIVADLDLSDESAFVADGTDGAALVWTSSNEDVIATYGKVTLPSGATASVDLTVTATVGTATATKTYTVVVADKDALEVNTVTEAVAMDDGTVVLVEGVVTGMRYGKPFLQDADGGVIFVYSNIDTKVGDKIKVFGKLTTYSGNGNDLKQIKDAVLMETVSSGNATVFDTTTTPSELASDLKGLHSTPFTMTLKWLSTDTDEGYYFFEGFVDASDATKNVRIKMDTDWFPTLETYLADTTNEIQVSFIYYGVHYDEARIVPVGFPSLTNAEKLALTQAMIDVAATDVTNDLDLPTEVAMFDAVITWDASANSAVANDGTVTRPASGEADVTGNVVASVVIGTDAAVESTFAVTVLAEPAVAASVTTTLTLDNDAAVYVTGTVNFILDDGTFWIEDTDGTAIYVDDYQATITWGDLTVAVGDIVEVTGAKGLYKVALVDAVTDVTVISSGNATYTGVTAVSDLATFRANTLVTEFGQRYSFTNVTVVNATSTYVYFYTSDGTSDGNQKLGLYKNEGVDLPTIAAGDTLTFTGFLVGCNSNPFDADGTIWRFVIESTDDITITPAS